MKVNELKEILNQYDDDDSVILFDESLKDKFTYPYVEIMSHSKRVTTNCFGFSHNCNSLKEVSLVLKFKPTPLNDCDKIDLYYKIEEELKMRELEKKLGMK